MGLTFSSVAAYARKNILSIWKHNLVSPNSHASRVALNTTFQWLLLAYAAVLVLDQFVPIPYLRTAFGVVLLAGIGSVLFPARRTHEKATAADALLIWALGILAAGAIFTQLAPFGAIRIIFAAATGVTLITLGYLIYEDKAKWTRTQLDGPALIVALCVAVVPILVFYLQLIHLPLNALTVGITTTCVALGAYTIHRTGAHHANNG